MIIPSLAASGAQDMAVPLARYAQIVNYDECALWGVRDDTLPDRACRPIWTVQQREDARRYLALAQSMIEEQVRYPLVDRWFVEEHPLTLGEREWNTLCCWGAVGPVVLDHAYLVEAGARAKTLVSAALAPDYTIDPATVTLSAALLDGLYGVDNWPAPDEIVLEHDNGETIYSSGYMADASGYSYTVPWCRLVQPGLAALATPGEPLHYEDPTIYALTVQAWWERSDPAYQAAFLDASGEVVRLGRADPYNATLGHVLVTPATTDGDITLLPAVSAASPLVVGCRPRWLRLRVYYRARGPLTRELESAIVRLAHTLMPSEPCGCEVLTAMWERDREVPPVLTADYINNPLGVSAGAMNAYAWVRDNAKPRAITLGRLV